MRSVLLLLLVVCGHLVSGQRINEIRQQLLDENSRVVLVAAHRAPHDRYPENSLDAIREGIRMGVDIIELDVKVSRDGVPFLMHDHTLDRTTTGKGEAEAYTWSELQKLFIVDQGRVTNLRIPSLEEALMLTRDRAMVDLDLKTSEIEPVIEVVEKVRAGKSVIFFDSDTSILARVEKAGDYLIMPRARSKETTQVLMKRFRPEIIHIDPSFYNDALTLYIRDNGARVWINALGERDRLLRRGKARKVVRQLTRSGANVIQTDEPALLIRALRRRGMRP